MLQASHGVGNVATQNHRNRFPVAERNCLFGRVAKAIWPHKTRQHLAFAAGASERMAGYWISGESEPSARAVRAVLNAIFSD